MNAAELLDALERHYRKPGADRDGEVLLREPQAPGSQRRCDLLRIGLWRSRGEGIDGHEAKVSRSDWLRELDQPAKAEAWWPYVHRWWIVAPSTDVVDPAELPDGWGLLVPPSGPRGRRFKPLVRAASKQPRVTVALMVELIRRTDNARLAERDRALARQQETHNDKLRQVRADAAAKGLDPAVRSRLEMLERLEKALGVELSDWISLYSDRLMATPEQLGTVLGDAVGARLALEKVRQKLAYAADAITEQCRAAADRVERIELPAPLNGEDSDV